MKTHKNLDVWQDSVVFITEVYDKTRLFPKEEMYGLTQQIRRAAISIGSNISEGAARNSTKDFIRFLSISLGSHAEIELQLVVARNLHFLSEENYQSLYDQNAKIGKMLVGLIRSLERKTGHR